MHFLMLIGALGYAAVLDQIDLVLIVTLATVGTSYAVDVCHKFSEYITYC